MGSSVSNTLHAVLCLAGPGSAAGGLDTAVSPSAQSVTTLALLAGLPCTRLARAACIMQTPPARVVAVEQPLCRRCLTPPYADGNTGRTSLLTTQTSGWPLAHTHAGAHLSARSNALALARQTSPEAEPESGTLPFRRSTCSYRKSAFRPPRDGG